MTEAYSVLMSVYKGDRADYLRTAFLSMLDQTVRPDEIVLVEDGPLEKETDVLIKELDQTAAQRGVRLILLPLEKNSGLGAALDEGMKSCHHDLIARMDADDISLPDRCEKELLAFEKDPDLSILSGAIAEFEEDPGEIKAVRRVPLTQEGILHQMRTRSPFNHPAVMYRKSAVIRAGGYGHSARKEDHDLFSRMLFGCRMKAANLPDILLKYRIGKDNIKRRKSWKNVRSYFEIMHLNRERGYVGLKDCIFVDAAQVFYFLAPEKVVDWAVRKFLRKEVKGDGKGQDS